MNYFSTSLNVTVIESYGQVKVADNSGQPLAKVNRNLSKCIEYMFILGICKVLCKAKERDNSIL